jgi:hypothetical protein
MNTYIPTNYTIELINIHIDLQKVFNYITEIIDYRLENNIYYIQFNINGKGSIKDIEHWYKIVDIVKYLHSINIIGINMSEFYLNNNNIIKLLRLDYTADYNYLAPEALLYGLNNLKSNDYWSLGVLLYKISTNHYPFSDYEDIINIVYDIHILNPNISDILKNIFVYGDRKLPNYKARSYRGFKLLGCKKYAIDYFLKKIENSKILTEFDKYMLKIQDKYKFLIFIESNFSTIQDNYNTKLLVLKQLLYYIQNDYCYTSYKYFKMLNKYLEPILNKTNSKINFIV